MSMDLQIQIYPCELFPAFHRHPISINTHDYVSMYLKNTCQSCQGLVNYQSVTPRQSNYVSVGQSHAIEDIFQMRGSCLTRI